MASDDSSLAYRFLCGPRSGRRMTMIVGARTHDQPPNSHRSLSPAAAGISATSLCQQLSAVCHGTTVDWQRLNRECHNRTGKLRRRNFRCSRPMCSGFPCKADSGAKFEGQNAHRRIISTAKEGFDSRRALRHELAHQRDKYTRSEEKNRIGFFRKFFENSN